MASPARHLVLVAIAAMLAVAAPRTADAWGGGRFFFSKTTRAEPAAVEPQKPAAADPNAAPAFSRSSSTGGGRGYGLYGRPEETYPPNYFRRGVHRNADKLTTTAATNLPATTRAEEAAVPVQGGRAQQYPEDGSGRGRPQTNVPATTTTTDTEEEEAAAVGGASGDLEGVEPYPENGSGRGRPPWYYTAFRGGRRQQGQEQEQRDYGMSDTRLYQNGRYYYDVDAGRYGYGRESNPMGTRHEEEEQQHGSGYGRPGGDRRGRYGDDAAAAGYRQYGNGDEFGNGGMDQNQNERYIP